MNPFLHLSTLFRVPSGVIAMHIFSCELKRFIRYSVKSDFFFFGTGIPPIDLSKWPSGGKNHDSFIKKPASLPTDKYAILPNIKSQLLVCGATQMTHLGKSGVEISIFHPNNFSINPAKFKSLFF